MDTEKLGLFLEQQGFSDEGIDEYLEHFGMRGQKWGVRNSSSSRSSSSSSGKTKTYKTLAVIGGGVAGRIIAKHFGLPVAKTTIGAAAGVAVTLKLLDMHGQKKANDVKNARRVLFGDK